MSARSPKVSVGMPVYNGERYVADAIESMLAQTFPDFELIISDNASTDRTEEICRGYAAADSRVHYYRNEHNLGANRNFNRAFELSAGEYYMCCAHDDMRAPTFLTRCVEALDANRDLVLAYTRTAIIDEFGAVVSPDDGGRFRTESLVPHVRFYELVRTPHECYQMLGMFRTRALTKTPVLGPYTSSDFVLLAELSLIGPFHEVPESLTFYRHHPQQSIQLDRHERMVWSGSGLDSRVTFPQWRLFLELLTCIQRVPLPPNERIRCYGTMLCWPLWYRNWRRMGKDVLRGTMYMLGPQLFVIWSRLRSWRANGDSAKLAGDGERDRIEHLL